jgi:hypothetical protein
MIAWTIIVTNDDEEITVGVAQGPVVPRVGEILWLHGVEGRRYSVEVETVAYWVPMKNWGYEPLNVTSCAIYVKEISMGIAGQPTLVDLGKSG